MVTLSQPIVFIAPVAGWEWNPAPRKSLLIPSFFHWLPQLLPSHIYIQELWSHEAGEVMIPGYQYHRFADHYHFPFHRGTTGWSQQFGRDSRWGFSKWGKKNQQSTLSLKTRKAHEIVEEAGQSSTTMRFDSTSPSIRTFNKLEHGKMQM